MKKKKKTKDSLDEGKTCGDKTLEEFGRDEMKARGQPTPHKGEILNY